MSFGVMTHHRGFQLQNTNYYVSELGYRTIHDQMIIDWIQSCLFKKMSYATVQWYICGYMMFFFLVLISIDQQNIVIRRLT